MSACFQRLDGKPIDADVVYRYRLIDSIVDGNAKNLRVHVSPPNAEQTTYEMVWPDGSREEIVGREAMLELIKDERSSRGSRPSRNEPIRQVMRAGHKGAGPPGRAALSGQAPRAVLRARRTPRRADRPDRRGARHPLRLPAPLDDRAPDQAHIRERFETGLRRPAGDRPAEDARPGLRLPAHLRGRARCARTAASASSTSSSGAASVSSHHPALTRAGRPRTSSSSTSSTTPSSASTSTSTPSTARTTWTRSPSTSIPDEWTRAGRGRRAARYHAGETTAERPEAFVLFERGAIEAAHRSRRGPHRSSGAKSGNSRRSPSATPTYAAEHRDAGHVRTVRRRS